MLKTESRKTVRPGQGASARAEPLRLSGKVAEPFTFHGHRLSSLYRGLKSPDNPFIFLKILKGRPVWRAVRFEYLWKDERQGGAHA